MPVFYIKGYKLDIDKISANKEQNPNIIHSIVNMLMRESYMYIGSGEDDSDGVVMVVVLAQGNTKKELDNLPMPKFNTTGGEEFLTAGVWRSW